MKILYCISEFVAFFYFDFLKSIFLFFVLSGQASHVQVFHDAMNEIMEKTKVNGKKCIDFQPRKAEHGYMQFTYGSG